MTVPLIAEFDPALTSSSIHEEFSMERLARKVCEVLHGRFMQCLRYPFVGS
jgi:hypothetical protein